MASTYENNLRLNEMGTGDQSGTWGQVTNTNLELIAEAFSYQTEATFGSNADATATIGDGVSDKYRGMYIKVTSATSLSGVTKILNIAPNTVSKMFLIENATTGGQPIAISQGSGANITIANGSTKLIFTDGLGSGAAVHDGLAKLELEANITIGGSTLATQIANFITASSTTTFTNKTFDADGTGNSLTNVEDANIKASAAIDAAKIANGTVSNTEFQYLNGVTSALQTQINNIYPVGSIYMNATNATNPNTLLGFGTWVRFGEGRMVISQHSANSRWNAAEETGGSEAITLTEAQIPSHRHSQATQSAPRVEYYGGAETSIQEFQDGSLAPVGTTATYYTGYTGSGGSHDNMPPFITVYMWKRTA